MNTGPHLHSNDLRTFVFITLAVFVVYVCSSNPGSLDSFWQPFCAEQLITHGTLSLDPYISYIQELGGAGVIKVGDHYYNSFPWGTCVFASPLLPLFNLVRRHSALAPLVLGENFLFERFAASLIAALACAVFYVVRRSQASRLSSFLHAITFAFCTPLWSSVSRGLWQSGPAMLCICCALCCVQYRSILRPWSFALGVFTAASYVIRPTSILSVLAFGIWLLAQERKQFLSYLLGVLTIVLPATVVNLQIGWGPLPPYFHPARLKISPQFFEALAANLISPGRGLYVFCPFLLFGIPAFCAAFSAGFDFRARSSGQVLRALLAGVCVLHLLAISLFPHWWAGCSFGPRFMIDVIPYLLFLFPASLPSSLVRRAGLAVCVFISGCIHYRGATSMAVYTWNLTPRHVDTDPGRIWDWRDLSFLRQ